MAAYYNPYSIYPASYTTPVNYPMQNPGYNYAPQPPTPPQQSYAMQGQKAMEWVEGEVGAKAFQMPTGLPANQPIPLWDSTDTVIYLKSWSPMGIPNPMQKLKYEILDQNSPVLPSEGMSGSTSGYATKDDLKGLMEEIQSLKETMTSRRNADRNNNQGNRGGANNG